MHDPPKKSSINRACQIYLIMTKTIPKFFNTWWYAAWCNPRSHDRKKGLKPSLSKPISLILPKIFRLSTFVALDQPSQNAFFSLFVFPFIFILIIWHYLLGLDLIIKIFWVCLEGVPRCWQHNCYQSNGCTQQQANIISTILGYFFVLISCSTAVFFIFLSLLLWRLPKILDQNPLLEVEASSVSSWPEENEMASWSKLIYYFYCFNFFLFSVGWGSSITFHQEALHL